MLFIIIIRIYYCIILITYKYRPNRHVIFFGNSSESAFGQTTFTYRIRNLSNIITISPSVEDTVQYHERKDFLIFAYQIFCNQRPNTEKKGKKGRKR